MTVNLSLVLCLDSFLRSRNTHDHEATAMMKAQFMSLWDGEFYTILAESVPILVTSITSI